MSHGGFSSGKVSSDSSHKKGGGSPNRIKNCRPSILASDTSGSAPSYHYYGLAPSRSLSFTPTEPSEDADGAPYPSENSVEDALVRGEQDYSSRKHSLEPWDGVLAPSPIEQTPPLRLPKQTRNPCPLPIEDSFANSVYKVTPAPEAAPSQHATEDHDRNQQLSESQEYDDSIMYDDDQDYTSHAQRPDDDEFQPVPNMTGTALMDDLYVPEAPPDIPVRPINPYFDDDDVFVTQETQPTQIIDQDIRDAGQAASQHQYGGSSHSSSFEETQPSSERDKPPGWQYTHSAYPTYNHDCSIGESSVEFEETQPAVERDKPPGWRCDVLPLLSTQRQDLVKTQSLPVRPDVAQTNEADSFSDNEDVPARRRGVPKHNSTVARSESMEVVPDSQPPLSWERHSSMDIDASDISEEPRSFGNIEPESTVKKLRRLPQRTEEGSEEDIPLWKKSASKSKDAQNSPAVSPFTPRPSVSKAKDAEVPASSTSRTTIKDNDARRRSTPVSSTGRTHGINAIRRPLQMEEVPSSDPEQDYPLPPESDSNGGQEASPVKGSSSRPTRITKRRKVATARGRGIKDTKDDDVSNKEESSEVVEDEGKRSLKRKRGTAKTASVKKSSSKATESSSRQGTQQPPTRVFALWKEDGFYYAGVVDSVEGIRYRIGFADGNFDMVDIKHMRRNDLRSGDEVLIDSEMFTVKSAHDDIVTLVSQEGSFDVNILQIRIASSTVERLWTDRTIDCASVVAEPAPRQSSTPAVSCPVPLLKRKLFEGMAFLLTSSVFKTSDGQAAPPKALLKDNVAGYISKHGGQVIDNWSDVISLSGTFTSRGKSWSMRKEEARWIGRSIQKLFLLSNDHCTKTKYLTAIALGVPCVNTEYITESMRAEELQEWDKYLLDQGTSVFGTSAIRVSQRVDLNWCMSTGDVCAIMESQVATKLLLGKVVLCLGAEFVPQPPDKRIDNRKTPVASDNESFGLVPHIILAMGAVFVEAVNDIVHLSRPLDNFDLVVTKGPNNAPQLKNKAVSFGWVKNSLILGRCLPLEEYRFTP